MNVHERSINKSDRGFRKEFEKVTGVALPANEQPYKGKMYSFKGWPEFATHMKAPSEMFPWEKMLFQFVDLPQPYLEENRDKALSTIRTHLRKYGGGTPECRYTHISRKIKKMLNVAMPQLLSVAYLGDKLPTFQEQWLYNIPRLLPYAPEVVTILPFLIVSYIISIVEASGSMFDPFDSNDYTQYKGWTTIFQSIPVSRSEDPMDNSETYIWNLSQKFAQGFNTEYEQFFNYGTPPHPLKRVRRGPKGKDALPSDELVAINRIRAWEYYRCFLILCDACDKVFCDRVNITLSMAMFSSIWDWKCPTLDCSEMLFDAPQYSLEDVKQDTPRSEILSFTSNKVGSTAVSLEDEVRYLGCLYSMTSSSIKAVDTAYNFLEEVEGTEDPKEKL